MNSFQTPTRTFAVNVTFTPAPVVFSVDPATAQLLRDLFISPPPTPSVLDRLNALESQMSVETDKVTEVQTHVATLVTFVTDLKSQITDLKSKIGNDPAVLDGLTAIETSIDQLSATVPPLANPPVVDPNEPPAA